MLPLDSTGAMSVPSLFQYHWELYPRVYVAQKTLIPLVDNLDGDLEKDVWTTVPWSDVFDDIRGIKDAPDDERPGPTCQTRFKALWDDTYLYIGAKIESTVLPTQAHYTERNSPIYQKDTDFEVFIDPLGTCHNYKELEINALNTVWNLMLNRPYDDGGGEHSGRIAKPGDDLYYEVYKQKTAVKIIKGKLNHPHIGATWTVEMALSFDDILANITTQSQKKNNNNDDDDDDRSSTSSRSSTSVGSHKSSPPNIGDMWRINFSRVENQGEVNWTWQPQIVWDPKRQRYSGFIAMHLPDAWGYIIFDDHRHGHQTAVTTTKSNENQETVDTPSLPIGQIEATATAADDTTTTTTTKATTTLRDSTWPGRLAAMNVYYAQHTYFESKGSYASNLHQLENLLDPSTIEPFNIEIQNNNNNTENKEFLVIVRGNQDGSIVTVTHDRLLQVKYP